MNSARVGFSPEAWGAASAGVRFSLKSRGVVLSGSRFLLVIEVAASAGPGFSLKVEVVTSGGIFFKCRFDGQDVVVGFFLFNGLFEAIVVKPLVLSWVKLLQGELLGKVAIGFGC